MSASDLPFLALMTGALGWIAWLLAKPWLLRRKRQLLAKEPFPEAWRAILKARVPYFRSLPADLQMQLKGHIQVFVSEKAFIGCNGLEVTDEMRVTVAAQACLLLLNRQADYFPSLRQILLYPGPFIVRRSQTDYAGVRQDSRQVLSGESWSNGQVILSWEDVVDGAADVSDGKNVVIHEFAHQLDQEKGAANGAPILAPHHAQRWARVMSEAYQRLQEESSSNDRDAHDQNEAPSYVGGIGRSPIDHYGATDPVEFFAVASETFFERAQSLATEHPELYRELVQFYGVNPLSW